MDWKPERAVQAKVRDFQNKRKIKQKAWLLRRANGGTLCVGLQVATSSKLWVNNGLYPQETSVATLYQVLPRQRLDLFTIILSPRKICRVFVLRCHSASHLTCFVSFHRVHLSYVIIQSYNHPQFIQSNKSHSFIQLYIHTWILSHNNAYTACTQYQSIRGCIGHPTFCLTMSLQFCLYLSLGLAAKNKHLAFTLLLIKNVIPGVSGPETSLIKPSGLWRNLLRNRVDSRKPFIKSPVDSGETFYQKPGGFSQTFYQKPGGFSQTVYQKPSGFWRNLLRNRVDFQQTFINQTDSLQSFSLIKSSHVPSVSFVCWSLSQQG